MRNLFHTGYIGVLLLCLVVIATNCTTSEESGGGATSPSLLQYSDSLLQANPDSVLALVTIYEELDELLDTRLDIRQALLEAKIAAYKQKGYRDSINLYLQELATLHLRTGDTLLLVDLL